MNRSAMIKVPRKQTKPCDLNKHHDECWYSIDNRVSAICRSDKFLWQICRNFLNGRVAKEFDDKFFGNLSALRTHTIFTTRQISVGDKSQTHFSKNNFCDKFSSVLLRNPKVELFSAHPAFFKAIFKIFSSKK